MGLISVRRVKSRRRQNNEEQTRSLRSLRPEHPRSEHLTGVKPRRGRLLLRLFRRVRAHAPTWRMTELAAPLDCASLSNDMLHSRTGREDPPFADRLGGVELTPVLEASRKALGARANWVSWLRAVPSFFTGLRGLPRLGQPLSHRWRKRTGAVNARLMGRGTLCGA